jgi:uncharacterized protein (DUF1800 family)
MTVVQRPPQAIDRRFTSKTTHERVLTLDRERPAPARSRSDSERRSYKASSGPPDLTPVRDPLTPSMAGHLLRRTGFGARPEDVDRWTGVPADEAVDTIVAESMRISTYRAPRWIKNRPPLPEAPEAAVDEFFRMNDAWTMELLIALLGEWAEGSLRQRMMLFWHDHFSTSLDKYELASFSATHLDIFRRWGLGSFRSLLSLVGKDPAMLLYLDGFLNERLAPNENYARELLELFTMGRVGPDGTPNYTEDDISEMARALTGWTVDWRTLRADFLPELQDSGSKTVFGQTGPYDYDSVFALIFQKRGLQTAYYICEKLFREFVHQDPVQDVIMALAIEFRKGGYQIVDLLKILFKSRYFFDASGAVGARIKSPIELLVGMVRETGIVVSEPVYTDMYWAAAELGQQILFPPNVAGWTGHKDWLNTVTLPSRWDLSSWFAYHGFPDSDPAVVAWANQLVDPSDATSIFRLPLAMMQQLIPVPVEVLGLPTGSAGLGGNLIEFPIPDTIRSELPAEAIGLTSQMLSGVPWYEWDIFQPQSAGLIRSFLSHLVQRPEFQLI